MTAEEYRAAQYKAMSEADHGREIMAWAERMQHAHPKLALLYHIPNGGHRHKKTAANLKAEGVKPGVPDYCLPVARGGHHGCYLELEKVGGRLRPAQKQWLSRLQDEGYAVFVAWGHLEAGTMLLEYLDS